MSGWNSTSNVEIGQTTYSDNGGRVGREGREGSEGQIHKDEHREGGSGMGRGPLATEKGMYLNLCAGSPSFYVRRGGMQTQIRAPI